LKKGFVGLFVSKSSKLLHYLCQEQTV
jgi:hypothetical protein